MAASTGQQYVGKNQGSVLYGTTASFFNAKISSPRISQDNTTQPSSVMPVIKGNNISRLT